MSQEFINEEVVKNEPENHDLKLTMIKNEIINFIKDSPDRLDIINKLIESEILRKQTQNNHLSSVPGQQLNSSEVTKEELNSSEVIKNELNSPEITKGELESRILKLTIINNEIKNKIRQWIKEIPERLGLVNVSKDPENPIYLYIKGDNYGKYSTILCEYEAFTYRNFNNLKDEFRMIDNDCIKMRTLHDYYPVYNRLVKMIESTIDVDTLLKEYDTFDLINTEGNLAIWYDLYLPLTRDQEIIFAERIYQLEKDKKELKKIVDEKDGEIKDQNMQSEKLKEYWLMQIDNLKNTHKKEVEQMENYHKKELQEMKEKLISQKSTMEHIFQTKMSKLVLENSELKRQLNEENNNHKNGSNIQENYNGNYNTAFGISSRQTVKSLEILAEKKEQLEKLEKDLNCLLTNSDSVAPILNNLNEIEKLTEEIKVLEKKCRSIQRDKEILKCTEDKNENNSLAVECSDESIMINSLSDEKFEMEEVD